jgi:ubiquinone/menaquinone biosynthesis C-methylase UbiE
MNSAVPMRLLVLIVLLLRLAPAAAAQGVGLERVLPGETTYTYSAPSRHGIGKFYMGREIARVMGHRGARWLERPTRVDEELPARVIEAMELVPEATVADVGAGTGYFTIRIAPLIPDGQLYAVDIQDEMLDIIRRRAEHLGLANIFPVRARPDNPLLPEGSIDAALIVDAYHEFSQPYEMMRALMAALRPGGRLYLVEYRGEDPRVAIKPIHKMTQAQAIKEMYAVGLQWRQTHDFLPTQHLMVFQKPVADSAGGAWAPENALP